MSIKVEVADLARVLRDFETAYLISTDQSGRAKVINVELRAEGEELISLNGSRGTAANLEHNSAVTILCPPVQTGGMSLLIDGEATAEGERFRILPGHAILHRPAKEALAKHAPDESASGN